MRNTDQRSPGKWCRFFVVVGGTVAAACSGTTASVGDGLDASIRDGDIVTPAPCAARTVFELAIVNGASSDFCEGPVGACTSRWLTIMRADRTVLALDDDCETLCGDCTQRGCTGTGGSCQGQSRVPERGLQRTWNGTIFTASTCGANVKCIEPVCAGQGHYIARFCAYKNLAPVDAGSQCLPDNTPTCKEVEFDWPTDKVRGAISP